MARSVNLRAYGKINLGLDVTGIREDGYHLVRMVMQSVGIYDRITITVTETPGIVLSNNLYYLPVDRKNLAYRAAELLMEEYGVREGIRIAIDKHIPVAGGMAGGSTDAAAVLFGVNRLFGLSLSIEDLMERGLTLGADVPFCVARGTMLAEGIGEKLSPLPAMPDCHLVIAKPSFPVSTREVYGTLDTLMDEAKDDPSKMPYRRPDTEALIKSLGAGDLRGICDSVGNILENVTCKAHPEIDRIKDAMMTGGAMAAMMSGSGPTVFGIYDSREAAEKTYELLKYGDRRGLAKQVYLTRPYRPGNRRKGNAG